MRAEGGGDGDGDGDLIDGKSDDEPDANDRGSDRHRGTGKRLSRDKHFCFTTQLQPTWYAHLPVPIGLRRASFCVALNALLFPSQIQECHARRIDGLRVLSVPRQRAWRAGCLVPPRSLQRNILESQ